MPSSRTSTTVTPAAARATAAPYAGLLRLLLASLVALFYYRWSDSTLLADFGGDNAVYWLTANHYSPYGTALAPAAQFAADSVYPPLYPWLLALSGGGRSLLAAHRVTAGILLLALFAVYRCGVALGLTRNVALATTLLVAASRVTLLEGLELHSEHLYLLLSMSAIALITNSKGGGLPLALAALAIAGAYLTRTAGLTLSASFLLWLALARPPAAARLALLVAAPLVLWSTLQASSEHYLGNLLGMYADTGVTAQLMKNLGALWPAWLGCFGEIGQAGFLPIIPAAIAACCVLAMAQRLRARSFDGIYAPAYLALTACWPYPAEYERLLFSLLPLLLLQTAAAMTALGARTARASQALLMALVLAAIGPFAVLVQARLGSPPADPGYAPYLRSRAWYYADPGTAFATLTYQRTLTEALADIRQHARVPPGECMLATKPAVVALYSGLTVAGLPASTGSDADIEQAIARGRCHYLFMTLGTSSTFPEPYFPYQRLKPRLDLLAVYRSPILKREAPVALFARLPRR